MNRPSQRPEHQFTADAGAGNQGSGDDAPAVFRKGVLITGVTASRRVTAAMN